MFPVLDTHQFNACTVFNMWAYTSLTSDIYNEIIDDVDAAIDPALYEVGSCPTL